MWNRGSTDAQTGLHELWGYESKYGSETKTGRMVVPARSQSESVEGSGLVGGDLNDP